MKQSQGILSVFNILTLKQGYWKTKTFLKKLKCCFLVGGAKIENVKFPCKNALSEANVKTNRMGCIKRTYHKVQSLATNYFFFGGGRGGGGV